MIQTGKTTNPSEALHHQRREVKVVGLRYVADESRKLAKADPENYSYVSHGTLSRIERSAGAWFRSNVDIGIVQSLVEILWNGDYQQFAKDTGLRLPLPLFAELEDLTEPPTVGVPYHLEGERPTIYMRNRRTMTPPYAGVDFMLQVATPDMQPTIEPGQVVGCLRKTNPEDGQMVVLLRDDGLRVAWYAGRNEFVTDRDARPFKLGPNESVYGIVGYVEPYRSNPRAPLPGALE